MHRSSARQRAAVVSADERALPDAAARLARGLRACVRAIEAAAFWTAALLPLAYLPLLAALQYAALDPALVVGVGVVNLLALLIGHRHDPTRFTPDASPQTTRD